MASGHVNRTQRPNTWQHRPSLRREESPCQSGAVHTWHLTDVARRAADVGSSRYSGHHDPAGSHPTPACTATMVTLAPADDGVLRMNRYPAIVASDEPTEATRFDSTAWAARVFGVSTMAAVATAKARGTKLDGNRGIKPTVKMRIQSAAARQQRASARAARYRTADSGAAGGRRCVIKTDRSRAQRQGYPDCAGEGAWTAPGEASVEAAGEIARFRSRF